MILNCLFLFYLISRLYSPSNSVRMLTPPEAFDKRKLPRTTGTLLEHVAEKLDYVVGDEFELCQRSFHFNLCGLRRSTVWSLTSAPGCRTLLLPSLRGMRRGGRLSLCGSDGRRGLSPRSLTCCNRGRFSCRGPRSLPTQESGICQGEGCATAGATFYLYYKSQINKPVFRQQTLGYVSLSCLASHSRGYCRSLSQCRSLSPCSC